MRILVMFDLPVETSTQQKSYRDFRKFLLTSGFIMEQYSVYTKLVLNSSVMKSVYKRVEAKVPAKGKIQMLSVTEKQYADMIYLIGEKQSVIIDTTERTTIL
ncbi:MAG: CRISPR-associated endonuclease Cas2 [Culicoidibacterales bacterium]